MDSSRIHTSYQYVSVTIHDIVFLLYKELYRSYYVGKDGMYSVVTNVVGGIIY